MRLSVVIPVYNEPDQVAETIHSVVSALREAQLDDAEIVVADDGSTVNVSTPARAAANGYTISITRAERNAGRFAARRAGLDAASGDFVLFVDAGVAIEPGSLAFVSDRVAKGADVWNAHTIIDSAGNPFGLFWNVVSSLAFGDYVDQPRETSFDESNFDRFPKGTTCFLAPRELLADAFESFRSRYADTRNANDDGPVIRAIARRRPINIAPQFACIYKPRRTLRSFVRHAFHRGVVFVDGHGRRESRFFPVVTAFFPVSVVVAAAAIRRPMLAPVFVVVLGAGAATVAATRHRPAAEVASFGMLAPVYGVAHGLGMWRGAWLALTARLRPGS